MSTGDRILVTGATGQQGFAVANALLEGGAAIRVLVRKPDHARAQELAGRGAEVATGDFDHPDTLAEALAGVTSVFGVTTPFGGGTDAEVRHGKTLVDAAKKAGIAHFVYSSVGGADQGTGIPHFDSKYEVEKHLVASGLAYTITGPVYFYENLLFPWSIPALKEGVLRMAMPADRKLQQVAVRDIGRFNALALRRPGDFAGKRIDYAGDDITGSEAAAILAKHAGREVAFAEQPVAEVYKQSEDLGLMYDWFNKVGYSSDLGALRRQYPEVEWLDYDRWAAAQDWKGLLG